MLYGYYHTICQKGNWIERRIIDENPESYRNRYSKRRIYYMDE